MVYCYGCGKYVLKTGVLDGKICCLDGHILGDNNDVTDVTFTEGVDGRIRASGTLRYTVESSYSASRERTLREAKESIELLMEALGIGGGDSIANPAMRLYEMALERSLTKGPGRRKELVQASCLYIICRNENKPYLLIDFSEYLKINVYALGAVFLGLCRVLSLTEHDIVKKNVDPSLFIHRFADRLFGDKKSIVSKTALHIVASMKRDWMQTGRKPSGLCGAALYISALAHGLKRSKFEVIRVVHICEATLQKRLIEFENTESGGLTVDEFNKKALELEKEEKSLKSCNSAFKVGELLCEHKGSGATHFAHGLCQSCYKEFITLSGGLDGGSEPPSFQRAEMERKKAKVSADQSFDDVAGKENGILNSENPRKTKNSSGSKDSQTSTPNVRRSSLPCNIACDSGKSGIHEADASFHKSETFFDIDDNEVNSYLYNEEEKKYKKIIWEEMNKEYLEEQATKEAAAIAAKEAHEAWLSNCSEDVKEARKLAAKAAEAVAKSKKDRQQKRAAELKKKGEHGSALEAAKDMLVRKRLSSRIRLDVLEQLLGESETAEITKKSRIEEKDDGKEDPVKDPSVETTEDHRYSENEEEDNYDDFENEEEYNYGDTEQHNYDNVDENNYDDDELDFFG